MLHISQCTEHVFFTQWCSVKSWILLYVQCKIVCTVHYSDLMELLPTCLWQYCVSSLTFRIISSGGMTEEKRVMRRKVLAKWLKESILRLGPTFINIGQQFSTRVDILPQEYVDQLSELQVCMLNLVDVLRQFLDRDLPLNRSMFILFFWWNTGTVFSSAGPSSSISFRDSGVNYWGRARGICE